jgi:hypothetical protein
MLLQSKKTSLSDKTGTTINGDSVSFARAYLFPSNKKSRRNDNHCGGEVNLTAFSIYRKLYQNAN